MYYSNVLFLIFCFGHIESLIPDNLKISSVDANAVTNGFYKQMKKIKSSMNTLTSADDLLKVTLPIYICRVSVNNIVQYNTNILDETFFLRMVMFDNSETISLKVKDDTGFLLELINSLRKLVVSNFGLAEIDESFLLRIPVDNFCNEKLYDVHKDIDISQSESIELLNKLFECNKLFRKYEPMEMSFMLKLCINKNKRWWFSSLFKSVNPDMGSYFSVMAGVFRSKAIQLLDCNSLIDLQSYLNFESCKEFDPIVICILQQYDSNYSCRLKETSDPIIKKALNIFTDNINIHTPSVAMPKDYAIAILKFLSQGKGMFHLFNPMDFWIVNLLCLNDGENLSQDENDFWIKCIIGSWKSKFIIQNVLQEYEKFFSQNKRNIEQDIIKRRLKD